MTTSATEPLEQVRPAPEPREPQRLAWQRLAFAVVVALAAGVLTYAISTAIPGTYRASTQLRVTVDGANGLGQDSVLAGNQLTAQLAQVAPTDAVLAAPAAQLGMSPSTLRSNLSVGTVAQQNILQISANGSSRVEAEQRATAVTAALLAFLGRDARTQLGSYHHLVTGVIRSMNAQISKLSGARGKLAPAQLGVIQGEAGAIAAQAQSLRAQFAQHTAAAVPMIQQVQSATSASKVTPKPLLYAIVALLVVGFVAVQLISIGERRARSV